MDSNKDNYEIIAYITLTDNRAQNGNPLILLAKTPEEQRSLCYDIAKALKADVVQLSCGDYMVIG